MYPERSFAPRGDHGRCRAKTQASRAAASPSAVGVGPGRRQSTPNPILEDDKLEQRELDVFKVREEVRRAGLENLRRAARLLNAQAGDPDFEKQTIVAGLNAGPSIDVGNL